MKFKLFKDILSYNGKYSRKSVIMVFSFFYSLGYATTGLFMTINTHVLDSFLLLAGGTIVSSIVDKMSMFGGTGNKKKKDEV